jgi:hypothetical protein
MNAKTYSALKGIDLIKKFKVAYAFALMMAIAFAFSMAACDQVSNPYPTKAPIAFIDTAGLDALAGSTEAKQYVLLEDFTGHKCGNCPRAAEDAARLSAQYGDRLIIMSVHSGYFAEYADTGKYSENFNTEAGTIYNETWGVDLFGLPQGMVNRRKFGSGTSPVITRGSWSTAISSTLTRSPVATIKCNGLKQSDKRILNIRAEVQALSAIPRSTSLVCWIVEDSVKGWQKDYSIPPPGDNIKNYSHRHALRKALNGTWGEVIAPQGLAAASIKKYYYGIQIPIAWNLEKIHAVVALFDTETKEILQVAEY